MRVFSARKPIVSSFALLPAFLLFVSHGHPTAAADLTDQNLIPDLATQSELSDLVSLDSALAEADHIIMLLPRHETTRHYLDKPRFSKMKAGAIVYNFGRGSTISEQDLVWALEHKIIAGAGLDVTEIEPLPIESALWHQDNVLLMPHSSCVFAEYQALHIDELSMLIPTMMQT